MNRVDSELLGPDVIKRVCGGYLATSKRSVAIRIGATGDTEDQARAAFHKIAERWLRAREAENAAIAIC